MPMTIANYPCQNSAQLSSLSPGETSWEAAHFHLGPGAIHSPSFLVNFGSLGRKPRLHGVLAKGLSSWLDGLNGRCDSSRPHGSRWENSEEGDSRMYIPFAGSRCCDLCRLYFYVIITIGRLITADIFTP